MKCPSGHEGAQLTSPDYGRGSEWTCYACDVYGRRFILKTEEAKRASDAARATSAATALELSKAGKI